MDLPVLPPIAPMLAKSITGVPRGSYSYEPKWDGFRCVVFRDGPEVELARLASSFAAHCNGLWLQYVIEPEVPHDEVCAASARIWKAALAPG